MMLRKLNLTYSDHRFKLLFRAIDQIGGDGYVEEVELGDFMFPECAQSHEMKLRLAASADDGNVAVDTDETRGIELTKAP